MADGARLSAGHGRAVVSRSRSDLAAGLLAVLLEGLIHRAPDGHGVTKRGIDVELNGAPVATI